MNSNILDIAIKDVSPRVRILGVEISAVNMRTALELAERSIDTGEQGYICVTGVHGIMEAQSDHGFREILNRSLLSVPDGMPTVWIGHLYGHKEMGRVYGPDFMLELCDRSQAKGYRHFLFGGNIGVAEQLGDALISRYPKLQVVGTYTPPFRPMDEVEIAALQDHLASTRPDILWVGLSTPKQERFMQTFLEKLDVKLMIGVGAAFDIHTGRIQDAPTWMKNSGLQWLHRLLQEPRRLARRYLINNPLFLLNMSGQLLADCVTGRLRPAGKN